MNAPLSFSCAANSPRWPPPPPLLVAGEDVRHVALADDLRRGRIASGEVTHHRRIAVQLDQQVRVIGSEAAQGQALGLQIGIHESTVTGTYRSVMPTMRSERPTHALTPMRTRMRTRSTRRARMPPPGSHGRDGGECRMIHSPKPVTAKNTIPNEDGNRTSRHA